MLRQSPVERPLGPGVVIRVVVLGIEIKPGKDRGFPSVLLTKIHELNEAVMRHVFHENALLTQQTDKTKNGNGVESAQ